MNQPSLNRRKDLEPKTRLAEVLAMLIINKKNWLSHYDFANALWNLNSHKRIGDLRGAGIRFEERSKSFVNKFDRTSRMKQFRMTTGIRDAKKIFKEINERSQ
jgi:hypothetical protein